MAISVNLLLDEDIIRFTNVDPTIGISPLDADDFNNNNTEFKDKLNELIAAVIAADNNNVKLTGAQDVDGIKTFLKNIKFTAGYGIGDSFLLINAQGSGDSSIRFKDTTNAALHYDATNDLFKLLTDSATLTSYAKLKIAAGAAAEDAVRYDQVPKLTTTNTFTLANTFDVAITQGVAATSANHLIRKTEFDTALASLSVGGILQQSGTPSVANNTLWINTTVAGIPTFLRGNGTTHDQIVWTVNPSTDIDLTGVPPGTATDSLLGLGIDIAGGSANGTFLGINKASFTGDFINAQVNGVSKFLVSAAGDIVVAGTALINGLTTFTLIPSCSVTPTSGNHLVNKTYSDLNSVKPDEIPNLVAWFKADAIVGLNDGDAVSTWSDSSPSGYNLTQGVAARRPVYKTNIINSTYPVVRFDGTNDTLENTGSGPGISASAGTVIVVFKATSIATNNATVNQNATVWQIADRCGLSLKSTNNEFWWNDDGAVDSTSAAIDTTNFFISIWQHSGGSLYGYQNKNTSATPATSGNTTSVNSLNLGADSALSYCFNGDIAEVIIYSTVISEAAIAQIRKYLNAKYAIYA